MTDPLDPSNQRLVQQKGLFTLSANSSETLFYWTDEDGWIQEILVKCNSPDLILEVNLGTDIDDMKISDAQDYGLNSPNASFWVPNYGGGAGDVYVIAYQPRNPQPYNSSVLVKVRNESAADITVNKVIFKRIQMKKEVVITTSTVVQPEQEYPPYGVEY